MKAGSVSKLILSVLVAVALSGCIGTMTGQLKNRVACDPSFMEMWMVSKYGPIGITADIDSQDAETTCQAILLYNMMNAGKPSK